MKQQINDWKHFKGGTLRELVWRRVYHLNPIKLDPFKHVYQHCMDRKEWAAFKYLAANDQFNDAVWGTSTAEVMNFPEDCPLRKWSQDWDHVRGGAPYPRMKTEWSRLPSSTQQYMIQWAKNDAWLRKTSREAQDHVSRCGDMVNTWGQLYRLWPTLLSLFDRDIRERVQFQKCKSKLNDECYTIDENGEPTLDPDFEEERSHVAAEMERQRSHVA
jgi:hypothetical protein